MCTCLLLRGKIIYLYIYIYVGRRMLSLELPGRRSRGRPKRRYIDVVREEECSHVSEGKNTIKKSLYDTGYMFSAYYYSL